MVTLLHEMQAKRCHIGLGYLCIGGGMGCSTIVKIEDYGIPIISGRISPLCGLENTTEMRNEVKTWTYFA
ncbi:MAG: hypothetical protein ACLU3F_14725 [Blautia wexlerae]